MLSALILASLLSSPVITPGSIHAAVVASVAQSSPSSVSPVDLRPAWTVMATGQAWDAVTTCYNLAHTEKVAEANAFFKSNTCQKALIVKGVFVGVYIWATNEINQHQGKGERARFVSYLIGIVGWVRGFLNVFEYARSK